MNILQQGPLLSIFVVMSVMLWSMLLHELGHYFYFRWQLKKKVVIRFGELAGRGHVLMVGRPRDYTGRTNYEKLGIYLAGILTGLLPLIWLVVLCWPYFPLVIFYLWWGCGPDIKNIRRCLKRQKLHSALSAVVKK